MLRRTVNVVALSILAVSATAAIAQSEIASITFESIPGGTTMANGGQPIELQADTNVSGSVSAAGEIEAGEGFRFPDGSVQVTAGSSSSGVTANAGLYRNMIADFTPPNAYTEICIKAGVVTSDIHAAGEPTSGGNCLAGDTGWVIERFERSDGATSWASARLECLKNGMRLPEVFEWQVSCADAALFALSDMTSDREWTSNATASVNGSNLLAASLGDGSCINGAGITVANSISTQSTARFRCVR